MAQVFKLVDDLDGTDATDTLQFSWGGDDYQIDLSEENADEFREVMSRYMNAGTRMAPQVLPTGLNGSARGRGTPQHPKSYLDAARTWARQEGHQVSWSGRVKNTILEGYAAHLAQQEEARDDTEES